MVIQIYVWSVIISLLLIHLILKNDERFIEIMKDENLTVKEATNRLSFFSFIPIVNLVLILEILQAMHFKDE